MLKMTRCRVVFPAVLLALYIAAFVFGAQSESRRLVSPKLLEEAGLMVINKADMLAFNEVDQILQLAKDQFKDKPIIVQNSLAKNDIKQWVDALLSGTYPLPVRPLEIDYDRYAAGESRMAWIDRVYELSANPQETPSILFDIISSWQKVLIENKWVSGHTKVMLRANGIHMKISLAQSDLKQNPEFTDFINHKKRYQKARVEIILNMLVEGNLDQVSTVMESAISNQAAKYRAGLEIQQSFNRQPGFPKPTYRITE